MTPGQIAFEKHMREKRYAKPTWADLTANQRAQWELEATKEQK